MGFASVFPCNITVLRSYDAMVWRCQTMFLNKWIKPSDLEFPSGNSYRICLAYFGKPPTHPVIRFSFTKQFWKVTWVGPKV